jgi:hypothetical protein
VKINWQSAKPEFPSFYEAVKINSKTDSKGHVRNHKKAPLTAL